MKCNLKMVEAFAYVNIFIGFFWLIFGSILYHKNYKYTDVSGNIAIDLAYIFAISFGCFLILWSIFGIRASYKKVNWQLSVYNGGTTFIFFAQLTILILAVIVTVRLSYLQDDTDCLEYTILKDLKKLNQMGYKTLCQSNCQCQFEGSSSDALRLGIQKYTSTFGENKVQDCEFFDNKSFDSYRNYTQLFENIEENFECSGFCSKNSYYVFSDINEGQPNKDCKEEVITYLDESMKKFLIASCIAFFILLVNFIFSCCLFHKKQKGQNFYEINNSVHNINVKQ